MVLTIEILIKVKPQTKTIIRISAKYCKQYGVAIKRWFLYSNASINQYCLSFYVKRSALQ